MDAQRAANLLGIPYYVWDFSDRFKADVVDDFIAEYTAGRTPNPCMRCNEKIKFSALLDRAVALGFDAVATGHYATIVRDAAGNPELHRASAWAKDQSYVLGVLTAEQLNYCYFPLGDTPSKALIREEAERRGLGVAQKPDSHDICFIPDGDTRGWLADKVGEQPGAVIDQSGEVVGEHQGAHGYTVGQRRGLHLGRPAPDGRARFVLEIRPKTNTVVVGPQEALAIGEIAGGRYSWAGVAPEHAEEWFACEVQIRAHADPVAGRARVTPIDQSQPVYREGATTEFVVVPDEPLHGVAPGQTAVVYLGTRVLGQFTIDRTVSAVPVAAAAATKGHEA